MSDAMNEYLGTNATKFPKTPSDTRISEIGQAHLETRFDISEFNTRLTLDDIGSMMSERMKESIYNRGGNLNLLHGLMPNHSRQYSSILQMKNIIDTGSVGFIRDGEISDTDPSSLEYLSQTANENDLSLGKADVMNIPFQFNELDDIRSNLDYTKIGRLYSERIYNYNLPKVLFLVGQLNTKMNALRIIGINNRTNDLNNYLRSGGENKIAWTMSRIKLAYNAGMNFVTGGFLRSKHFYSFKPSPKLYMRYVNEILLELSTYMDLAQPAIENTDYQRGGAAQDDSLTTTDNPETDEDETGYDESFSSLIDAPNTSFATGNPKMHDGIPSAQFYMGRRPLHIYNLIPGHGGTSENNTTGFGNAIGDIISDAEILSRQWFIPFMLQRGVSVSESFGNSTQEHPVLGQLNGISMRSQQDEMGRHLDINVMNKAAQGLMSGNTTDAISGLLSQSVRRITTRAAGRRGGEMGVILSGQGRFQFPEVWSDSNFDRGYNLTFKLFTPYGDRLSVFENIYIPFIMLLAMALPKQIGVASYVTPFFIRAFAKGLFSCELGIITSLSVSKGEDSGDRTFEGYPRSMIISMNIKDLTPKLSLSLDGGVFGIISAKNIGFKEYLFNMANIDMNDRIALVRKLGSALQYLRGNFNSDMLGIRFRSVISRRAPFQIYSWFSRKIFGTLGQGAKSRPLQKVY